VVDVVGEPDLHAARRGGRERALDDGGERVRQPQVVDRDLERVLGGAAEVGERLRGALGGLSAV
jgi:hypothetical protein